MKCYKYLSVIMLTSKGQRLFHKMNFSEPCYLVNHFICVIALGTEEWSLVLSNISRDSNFHEHPL